MKKYIMFLFVLFIPLIGGCSIDYESYYEKYDKIFSEDENLDSEKIDEETKEYPYDNGELIDKYGEIYYGEINNYSVYASYYSQKYDTLYISYDINDNPVQTIASKDMALMEEHLINYFVSNSAKTDYTNYLKVVRIYPDYKSSACRSDDNEENYSQIEGCAFYDSIKANINLNGLTSIDRFFNSYTYQEDGYSYTIEPKRDTFAHEFGHVSTYYNMILKSDDTYEAYLRLRLGNEFDNVYPDGFPEIYNTEESYYIQPVEILADDYVELFYDVSEKAANDYYEYELKYDDLRNSLENVSDVVQYLKDDDQLFNEMKEFYSLFIENDYVAYDTPIVVSANGTAYNTMHDVQEVIYKELDQDNVIALGEVTIKGQVYYRVILSNLVYDFNSRDEFSGNIGYILKDDCSELELDIIYFDTYDGQAMDTRDYLTFYVTDGYLLTYYDFSYLIVDGSSVLIYDYLSDDVVLLQMDLEDFQ